MKARIKNKVYSSSSDLSLWLKENAGKLIDIDTSCLFTDQYNTDGPNINGCSGFRIFDTHISEIIDDARIGKGKCKYCGKLLNVSEVICTKHPECVEHGVMWFTAKNCFFIAHPKGLQPPPKEKIEIKLRGTSYTLENSEWRDTWTIRNARKRIDFKYDGKRFWVESLGFIGRKFLDIPYEAQRKLILKLKELQPITAN